MPVPLSTMPYCDRPGRRHPVEEPAAPGADVVDLRPVDDEVVEPDAGRVARRTASDRTRERAAVEQRADGAASIDHRRAGHAVQGLARAREQRLARLIRPCLEAERIADRSCREERLEVCAGRNGDPGSRATGAIGSRRRDEPHRGEPDEGDQGGSNDRAHVNPSPSAGARR